MLVLQRISLQRENLNCLICSDLLIEPVKLKCNHELCLDCARMWFKEKNTCPFCRSEVKDWDRVNLDDLINNDLWLQIKEEFHEEVWSRLNEKFAKRLEEVESMNLFVKIYLEIYANKFSQLQKMDKSHVIH